MRTDNMRESENVEDRRGYGGGGMRPPMMIGGGIGGVLIIIVILLLGGNPQQLLQQMGQPQGGGGGGGGGGGSVATTPAQDQQAKFVAKVLGDTEDVWTEQFRKGGKRYQAPRLVLFSDTVDSACGMASAATGPFYCPADTKVYI
ncbi:MAG: neutral zinc metallopeptidase, partial [Phycisphaerales bacterium]